MSAAPDVDFDLDAGGVLPGYPPQAGRREQQALPQLGEVVRQARDRAADQVVGERFDLGLG